jgi:hypothetical protein
LVQVVPLEQHHHVVVALEVIQHLEHSPLLAEREDVLRDPHVQPLHKQLHLHQPMAVLVVTLEHQVAAVAVVIQLELHHQLQQQEQVQHLVIRAHLLLMVQVEMVEQVEPLQIAPAQQVVPTPVMVVAVQLQRALAAMLMVALAVLVL